MTIKSILAAALIFAGASAFAYRDAIAQTTSCNGMLGCWDGAPIPCSAGAGTCVNIAGAGEASVPGGNQPCTDSSIPQYYSDTLPPGWMDCQKPPANSTYPNCPRTSMLCTTVYFYKSSADCNNNSACSSNPINACAYGPPTPAGGGPPQLTGVSCSKGTSSP